MPRALVVALLLSVTLRAAAVQAPSVLHIKVVLVDAERKATPVSRHALLISDNPGTGPPRRIVTKPDGTADVRLPPGNYTVESDQPVAFQGKAYQWTQMVDIAAGRDAVLELTADNAAVESVAAGAVTSAALDAGTSSLLTQWQDSVVAIWTPSTHASGFVIDGRGIIATNQRGIGTATSVEVQITPAVKVAASVLAADPMRDVALLWIDPKAAASVRPVPLGCAQAAKPPVVDGQEIITIDVPLRQQKGMSYGTVSRVEAHAIVADLHLGTGAAGGPVFTAGGSVVGLTSVAEADAQGSRRDARVVRLDDVCDVVAAAEPKMKDAAPPNGTLLPVEPLRPFPVDVIKAAAARRAGSLNPYQVAASDFDLAFITPLMIYGVPYQPPPPSGRERAGAPQIVTVEPALVRPSMDFGNWSEYVADFPPVLLIRVTPRLVEGFWTKVARGAAETQGVALPPMKRLKSGFSRMRAFCGEAEVPAIHSFKIERRVSESDTISEGLYAFDPGALGPECGSVKLVLYSEKEPEKGDARVIDAKVVQQIWQDFAPYRDLR